MDHNPQMQLAANVIEACDYWAKAAEQTLELHAIARRSHASALDILLGNTRALTRGSQDAIKCVALAANIRVLCAGVAGALLRASGSTTQPEAHRATGAHLVDNEGRLAETILPVLRARRTAAMTAQQPTAYTEFVTGSAQEFAPVLNTLSRARAMGSQEGASQAAQRLVRAGQSAAPGVEVSAAVLAACAGGKRQAAVMLAAAGLPDYIALESAARVLEHEFARQRQDLVVKERELRASVLAERAAKNQHRLDRTGSPDPGARAPEANRGLNDFLSVHKDARQTAEQP